MHPSGFEGDRRLSVRLVTVLGVRRDAHLNERNEQPAGETFPGSGGMKEHYRANAIQAPYRVAAEAVPPDSIGWIPPTNGSDPDRTYRVESVTLELWRVPMAAYCLVADWVVDVTMPELQVLMADTYWRYRRLRYGQQTILEWGGQRLPGASDTDVSIDSGHQLILLDDGAPFLKREHSTPVSSDYGGVADEVDMPKLVRIMARSEDESRPGMNAIDFPETPNRLVGSICAVRESVSLASNRTDEEAHAYILSVIQTMAGRSRLGSLRARAFAALQEAAPDALSIDQSTLATSPEQMAERRKILADLSNELSQLQLALSFGVEANMNAGLILPVRGVAEHHVALVERTWLPQGVRFTSNMLERLAAVLRARETVLRTQQREDDERARADSKRRDEAFQELVAILGAVFLTPSLVVGVYGANITGLPGQDDQIGIVVLLALMVASAIATWIVLRLFRRLLNRDRESRAGQPYRDEG